MSKGSFYYHFLNKEDLFRYIVDTAIQEKIAFLKERINTAELAEKDIFEILKEQITHAMEFAKQRPLYAQFSQALLREKDVDRLAGLVKEHAEKTEEFLSFLIHTGYEKGHYDKSFPEVFMVRLMSLIFNHYYEIRGFSSDSDSEEWEENLVCLIRFLKKGFKAE
jgi:AcrR family transcriptional regulator